MSVCFLPVTGKQPVLLTLDLCVLHLKVKLLRSLTHRVAAVVVTGRVIGWPLVRLGLSVMWKLYQSGFFLASESSPDWPPAGAGCKSAAWPCLNASRCERAVTVEQTGALGDQKFLFTKTSLHWNLTLHGCKSFDVLANLHLSRFIQSCLESLWRPFAVRLGQITSNAFTPSTVPTPRMPSNQLQPPVPPAPRISGSSRRLAFHTTERKTAILTAILTACLQFRRQSRCLLRVWRGVKQLEIPVLQQVSL